MIKSSAEMINIKISLLDKGYVKKYLLIYWLGNISYF